eukprot:1047796-Pyramimonas_sp.AAC.1
MQASKAAGADGLFEGHDIQQADAKQACTQSNLGGNSNMDFPAARRVAARLERHENHVCPLIRSLYGHPDYGGGCWEQHCEGHVISKGLIKCRPWRSCYFHATLRLFPTIYVDGVRISGPRAKLEQ